MSIADPLNHAILRTLAYYDIFDYPLTLNELWRWLDPVPGSDLGPVDETMVAAALGRAELKDRIERGDEFITLAGRGDLAAVRRSRHADNEKKWQRAKTVARYLEIVPFIKMVALVNTAAIRNARPDSDIDLFIVTRPGHIWISRAMVTGIVSMLGYRRHGQHVANRICLSFYVTTEALDLAPQRTSDTDHHFTYWTAQAVPLLDDGTYERYVHANAWVRRRLPNAWQWDWRTHLVPENSGFRSTKRLYEAFFTSPLGAWIENVARRWQLKKFGQNRSSKVTEPTTDVIVSEDVLKFHEADRRREYNARFEARCRDLGL